MTAGDVVTLVIGVVSGVIALVAAGIAVRANRHAKEANDIAERALEVQRASRPPEWSGAIGIGEHAVRFTNDSSRTIVLLEIRVSPVERLPLVQFRRTLPLSVEYGDGIDVTVMQMLAGNVKSLTLVWRYPEEPEGTERETVRLV